MVILADHWLLIIVCGYVDLIHTCERLYGEFIFFYKVTSCLWKEEDICSSFTPELCELLNSSYFRCIEPNEPDIRKLQNQISQAAPFGFRDEI